MTQIIDGQTYESKDIPGFGMSFVPVKQTPKNRLIELIKAVGYNGLVKTGATINNNALVVQVYNEHCAVLLWDRTHQTFRNFQSSSGFGIFTSADDCAKFIVDIANCTNLK